MKRKQTWFSVSEERLSQRTRLYSPHGPCVQGTAVWKDEGDQGTVRDCGRHAAWCFQVPTEFHLYWCAAGLWWWHRWQWLQARSSSIYLWLQINMPWTGWSCCVQVFLSSTFVWRLWQLHWPYLTSITARALETFSLSLWPLRIWWELLWPLKVMQISKEHALLS